MREIPGNINLWEIQKTELKGNSTFYGRSYPSSDKTPKCPRSKVWTWSLEKKHLMMMTMLMMMMMMMMMMIIKSYSKRWHSSKENYRFHHAGGFLQRRSQGRGKLLQQPGGRTNLVPRVSLSTRREALDGAGLVIPLESLLYFDPQLGESGRLVTKSNAL